MKAEVIGVRVSTNAQGAKASNLYVSIPYTEYESSKADSCLGFKTAEHYLRQDLSNLKPGDKVNLEFEPGFEGKATLVGVHLAK